MHVIMERVKIDLDEDEIRRLIDAIDHYEAYLHSQQRDETKYRELLVRHRKCSGIDCEGTFVRSGFLVTAGACSRVTAKGHSVLSRYELLSVAPC